jgi:transcriptional regulator with XRE-family HTH domain
MRPAFLRRSHEFERLFLQTKWQKEYFEETTLTAVLNPIGLLQCVSFVDILLTAQKNADRSDNVDSRLVGKRIQMVRKERGLTQEQLSQLVDLSPNYLSNIETGLKTPKLDTFVEIINALQCDANSLLADVVDATTAKESGQLSKALAELPASEQRRILKVVEVLVAESKKQT